MKKMHSIHIGNNILSVLKKMKTVQSASAIVIITDENVAKYWLSPLLKVLSNKKIITICIEPGENHKTISTLEIIWKKMLEGGADRSSVVVTLGGGVVCDIGGFAAGTFMRGVPVIHIPTTLLAQVDASIGGKTAIDFCNIKNSIGMFYQPNAVIIDIQTLKTLPRRELVAAWGEIIKHGVIAGRTYFDLITAKKPEEFTESELIQIVQGSVKIKSDIVIKDLTETTGLRKIINFGHTIGHAVESLSLKTRTPLLHGEAIAIGMVGEAKLAHLLGIVSEKDFNLICNSIQNAGLPINVQNIKSEDIEKMIVSDKKNKQGEMRWSLPYFIGKVVSDIAAENMIVEQAISSVITP